MVQIKWLASKIPTLFVALAYFQGDSNSSSQIVFLFSNFVTNFHSYPGPRHPESSRIFGNLKVKAILDTNPFVSPGVRTRGWIGWMGAVHFILRGKEDPFFNQNASCVLGFVFAHSGMSGAEELSSFCAIHDTLHHCMIYILHTCPKV